MNKIRGLCSQLSQLDGASSWPCIRRWLRQAERGEEQSFEFSMAIIPLVLMIVIIAFATVVRAAQMPAYAAASQCARAAIATEDETLGRAQGEEAAINSLNGNSIIATAGQIEITGVWEPDSPITCRVSYDINVSGFPLFAELTGGKVPMVAEVTLRVEPYKSAWN